MPSAGDDPAAARRPLPTLLFQHWVGHREIVVSRFASPMSVRDQIVRARLLARQVVEAGVVGGSTPKGTVAVVGAGAAGVAFAVELLRATAAWSGLRVMVFERGEEVLAMQAGADHRMVDPTLYDWPAPHWPADRYPVRVDDPFPLSYEAATGDAVAKGWRDQLARDGATDRLTVVLGATVDFDRPRSRGCWLIRRFRRRFLRRAPQARAERARSITSVVKWKDANHVKVANTWNDGQVEASPHLLRRADCVLVVHAFGIGKERVFLDEQPEGARYRGHEFWFNDRYGETSNGRVLVAGGGDGAIQDLIRLATRCRNPSELFETLFGDASARLLSELGTLVRAAVDEELATWSAGSKRDETSAMVRLERAMDAALAEAEEEDPGVFQAAREVAEHRIGDRTVLVVHREPVYTHCYALNRLSALLLFRLLLPPKLDRRACGTLTDVRSASGDHTCADDASQCEAHRHLVTWKLGDDDDRECAEGTFDVVVIRHGRLAGDPGNDPLIRRIEGLVPSTGWRQLLPLDLDPITPAGGRPGEPQPRP